MVASLGVFMAFVDATIVNIAFPDISSSFSGSSVSALSWVLNAYNIVFAAFLLAGGKLADLLGRRRVFMIGLALFTIASGLCAIAPSAGALVAFRILQAIGAALVVPASLALVLDAFPADRRAHAVALFSAVAALAAGIGPSLGGLLVSVSDWRLVFVVNVPVGVIAYVLAKRHLVESRAPGRRRMPDLPGSIVFALSVSALVFGVIKGSEDWGWTDPRVLGAFAAAAVLGVLFVRRSARHRAPLFELSLLRSRTFAASNAMTIVASAGFYGYTLCNVLFLTYVWGYSALEAGLALTPGPFIAAAVAGPTSRLAERFGHRWVLVFGAIVWGAGVFWFVTQVGLFPDFVGAWLPGMVLLGIGAGATFPNLSGAAVASAPGESFGTATGLNSVARQVGAALGVAIVIAIIGMPTLFEATAAFDRAWTFCALALIGSGIGCLFVGRVGHDDDVRRSPSLVRATLSALSSPERVEAAPVYAPVLRRAADAGDSAAPRAETTSEFLKRVPLFADLPPLMRRMIAGRATNGRIAAGKTLFYAGDPGDSLYVVRAGRLEIVGADGSVLREIGRGACIGELAVLSQSTRAFTVRAARTSDLIRISASDFHNVLHDVPALSIALNRTLAEQLRGAGAAPAGARPRAATIALVPLDRGVPEATIAFALTASMGAHGRVAALRGTDVETPSYGEAAATYAPLLDRAEAANDQVVLVAGNPAQPDPWTDFCIQQADRVVAISSGGTPPAAALQRTELRGCDLVGWDVPVGSGALTEWTDAVDPIETHALHPHDLQAGIDRLGRRLSGRSIGLVLSGGGARGFSHIGVLEELLDAGVVIDRVAGVSMGAFIGGMFAMGMSPDEIDARAYDEWVRRSPLSDYTLPRHSLIRGHRAESMLRRTFGDARVEELARGFISTAADLRDGSQIVQRHGELWQNVGKSMAIPVLVPPVVEGRKLIVDGSLVDNLPIGPMADLAEGPIIAVDLKTSFEGPPPGTASRGERLPSIGETLTRVVFSGSSNTSEAARRHADLIIKPRNVGVGLFEWHQIDRARESGRAAARDAIERAPASVFG
jgi:EmrB/QacA subfamily drug resistance transporter